MVGYTTDNNNTGVEMDNKILGLDLGTNSVGWALFEGDENNVPIVPVWWMLKVEQRLMMSPLISQT